jgi:hypothetical protein
VLGDEDDAILRWLKDAGSISACEQLGDLGQSGALRFTWVVERGFANQQLVLRKIL